MIDLKEKIGKLGGWLALILSALLLLSVVGNIRKVISIQSQVQEGKQKIEKLKKENEELIGKIKQNQGPEFVEKQVRDKLGLIKEGERVVVLPDEDILRKLAPRVPQEEDTLPDPNWEKWLKLFI